MSNTIKTVLKLLCGLLLITGCKKFVEHDNVNNNPNRATYFTLATALPSVQYTTANNHGLLGFITTMFSQQTAAYASGPVNEDRNQEVRMNTAFEGLYNALTNAKLMVELARQQGAPHYRAIARVLFVTNMSLATDSYGDLPLAEAFRAPEILQPKYDKQEDIYAFMHKYLDSAIDEIAATNPAAYKVGTDDLVFGGNMEQWKRTAWLMKARLYMHTTKKGAIDASNQALAALANAFPPNVADYQLLFSDRNPNPWFVNVSGRISGSAVFTIAPSKRFVDAINGTSYPGLVDPRISKILGKSASAAQYTGIPNGTAQTGNTADIRDTTYYATRTAPLVMASYSEQKLLEAEARFLANNGTVTSTGSTQEAYDAYLAGITANMQKLGVPPAAIQAYTTNPQVAVGAAGLKLEHIMREKMVTMWLHPDVWVDVRRYDYNNTLWRGLELPANQSSIMNGQFIRRSLYPLEEIARNPNAQTATKPMNEKMWWDQ